MPSNIRRRSATATAAAYALSTALLLAPAAPILAARTAPLAVQETGSGKPAIVLVHSIGGDRSDWSAVAPKLAEHHRVLIVELPGHGQSPPLAGAPSVAGIAEALLKTLDDRKVEHAILVGHSYGALVALRAAVSKPKRAAAIVAVDAGTFTPADSVRIAEAERVLRERYPVFLSAVFQAMTRNEATGDSLFARAQRVEPATLAAYFRDSWREDLRPAIRSMKTPIHLVATDGLWPPAESWTSARKRLGYETAGPAQGHRVANSAHMVALDQPDSLASIIESVAAKP